jgi:hypothetical protein
MLLFYKHRITNREEHMQVSKWLYLACSTAAVVAWALYKVYRFYRSPEGQELMKQRDQNSQGAARNDQENHDKSA